ncbi:MAG: lantibiotic dehydratase [Myxococcaceae bacterium]|nr:lantibiotic dehydratase [Myxococcaceae bacterium]
MVTAADPSAALREVARDERFREAVTWQNRAAVVDGLDSLLRKPAGATDARTRKKELLVARYLQRYCAKNDTIGFFGPVGWGRFGDGEGHVRLGQSLIDARKTFVEPWAARVLADALARDPRWREDAELSLPGDVQISRRTAITPSGSYRLTADEARLLERLQVRGPLVARRLSRKARAIAEALAAQNLIRWTFPVSISADPLARLPDAPVVSAFRAHVDGLSGLDAATLGSRLDALSTEFEAATAHAAKRHEGQTYGGRGLVYEECRRAVELELSRSMRERIEAPVFLVCRVARWYSFEIARRVMRAARRFFGPRRAVPLHVFWAETAPLFAGAHPPAITPVARRLAAKWSKLWGPAPRVPLEVAERLVEKHFEAPCPGWPGARHHAPDILWAASSAEALLRGEGLPILGELHPGVTPFSTLSVLAHAPDRRALERQWQDDFGLDGITPIPWEDFARSSHDARLSRRHWHLDLGYEFDSDRPRGRVLRAADCEVVQRKGRLVVVHRDKGLTFDLLQVFERRIKMIAASHFSLSDGADSGPRRTLGDLVVQRARWRFGREQLAELDVDPGRSEAVRRFVATHQLPRRVFVRSPNEVKPVYLDWEAPLLVEQLVRLARQAEWLSLSEMLPGPDGLWLDGHVCELRCIAVDPVPFSAALVDEAARVSPRRRRGASR